MEAKPPLAWEEQKTPPLFFRMKTGFGGVTDVGENTGESALKQLKKSIALIITAPFV